MSLSESCGPAIIHCSAGIGRTGVIVAVDIGLQALANGDGKLDILRIVSTLRQDRAGCVQTNDQYGYVHQVSSLKTANFDKKSHWTMGYYSWFGHFPTSMVQNNSFMSNQRKQPILNRTGSKAIIHRLADFE